jgi:hypothetical protein
LYVGVDGYRNWRATVATVGGKAIKRDEWTLRTS